MGVSPIFKLSSKKLLMLVCLTCPENICFSKKNLGQIFDKSNLSSFCMYECEVQKYCHTHNCKTEKNMLL